MIGVMVPNVFAETSPEQAKHLGLCQKNKPNYKLSNSLFHTLDELK